MTVKRVFQTVLGEIWLHGAPEAFDPGRPRILALGGAFDNGKRFNNLQPHVPGASVVRGELPGNLCPELSEVSIEVYARAYDHVIGELGGPTLACGVSTGATVALAMRAPNITGILALDPVIRAGAHLWPLVPRVRAILAQHRAAWADTFAWKVLGISATDTAERDYASLAAAATVPVTVLAGETPLGEPRAFDTLPSLLGEPERAFLRGLPHVTFLVAARAGHDVVNQAPRAVLDAMTPWIAANATAARDFPSVRPRNPGET